MKKADAVHHYGSASALAEALGITLQAVGQWGEEVPLLRQYQLEKITGGKLKAVAPQARKETRRAQQA